MSEKKIFSSNTLVIGVFTLLAVGSWVAFDVYRGLTKSTIPKVLQEQIKPLKTEFDEELINNLKGRRQFSDEYLSTVESKALEEKEEPESAVELELIKEEGETTESVQASPSAEIE